MGYGPEYGQALGCCLPRRTFVAVVGFVILALSITKTCLFLWDRWYYSRSLTSDHPCWDVECYEMFSCKGMLGATENMREPLDTVAGLVLGFAGLVGAIYGRVGLVLLFAYYLFWAALFQALFIVTDLCLAPVCTAFPDNVIDQALLIMPVSPTIKYQLNAMPSHPTKQTYSVAQDAHIWVWYLVVALLKLVALGLCSNESFILSRIMDGGVWGVGVNYDLRRMDPITMAKRKALAAAQQRASWGEHGDESEPDEDDAYGLGVRLDDDDIEDRAQLNVYGHTAQAPGLRGSEPAEGQGGFYVGAGGGE